MQKLENGWVILDYPQECYICYKGKKIGKYIHDSFLCSNCVESLGASQ